MKFALAAIIVMIFIQALLWWPGADRYDNPGRFNSRAEKAEFNGLLAKHGLQYDVSVIFDYPQKPYFINARGQKCLFR